MARIASSELMQGGMHVREPLPCDAQTPELVAEWMQDHGTAGAVVVVRHSQLGLHEYLLDEVRRTDLRLKRIHLVDHGVFRLSGDYLAPPAGRFTLLAPVGAVLDAALAGDTWMNGRPAFRRPHSSRERALIDLLRQEQFGLD
jgi:hypothetical protein